MYRFCGICDQGQRIEHNMVKDRRRLLVDIGKALDQDLVLPLEMPIDSAGGDTGKFADILYADTLYPVLAYRLYRGGYYLLSGIAGHIPSSFRACVKHRRCDVPPAVVKLFIFSIISQNKKKIKYL